MTAAKQRIQSYYEESINRKSAEECTAEADLVSVHTAELLGENAFQFSPVELQRIHRRLFTGVYDYAGAFRTYNITKKEWILNDRTVTYASCDSIQDTLDYDFGQEKAFSYEGLSISESVRHIAKFASGLWQIHPFCEGNTRATAVFIIKYLKTFGFQINNDIFAKHSCILEMLWSEPTITISRMESIPQQSIWNSSLKIFFWDLIMNSETDIFMWIIRKNFKVQIHKLQSAKFAL